MHGHNLEKTLANMDGQGIAMSWLLACERPRSEHRHCAAYPVLPAGAVRGPLPLSYCVSYAERAPGRFLLGYAPDPRRPEAIDEMAAAIEIYDVRICGELKLRMMADHLDALVLYRFCGERGLPVVMHLEYPVGPDHGEARAMWYSGGIEPFERALWACPDTVFLGHGPGFWAHISGDELYRDATYPQGPLLPGGKVTELLRRYPNLYCDISAGSCLTALNRDLDFTRDFLAEFQDRVLYARDCFSGDHKAFLEGLELEQDILDKIFSGNALKLVPPRV